MFDDDLPHLCRRCAVGYGSWKLTSRIESRCFLLRRDFTRQRCVEKRKVTSNMYIIMEFGVGKPPAPVKQ